MDAVLLEELAIETYERLRLNPAEPRSTFEIAFRWLGPQAIERPPSLIGKSPAATFEHAGRRRIALRRSVPESYAPFFVGHELAHLLLADIRYRGTDIEMCCDYLGAALMAPRPAVHHLHRSFGFDLRSIAEETGSTQTWAALRLGEALGIPLAAVSPVVVRLRGTGDLTWPAEPVLRRWAASPSDKVRRIRVSDGPRRVVLVHE